MRADPQAIVVGAGPAGSIAALTLARAGVRVRLIDRAAFPRDKLCGDTLNPGTLAILDRLAVGERIRQAAVPTTGMTVTGPRGAAVSADYPDGLRGAALRRRHLDLFLLEAAVDAGAEFESGARALEPLTSGGRVTGVRVAGGRAVVAVHSRMVIAADGRASRLAAGLRLARLAPAPRRWAYGAYYMGVAGLTTRGEMHIRPDGYIGIAPLPGGVANVCIVRGARTPGVVRVPEAVIDGAIHGDGALRDRFAAAERISPISVLGPLAVDARAAGCPGLLLAGDAAGFVDPMTGDGMRFALRGGELAALAAIRELDTGVPAHRALARARHKEFHAKWRVNRALRSLVGSPCVLRVTSALARRWTAPIEYLIGVAGDVSLARHA